MNFEIKQRALLTAQTLYPQASLDELIVHASKLESYIAGQVPKKKTVLEFAESLTISHPVKGHMDINLYDFQKYILNSFVARDIMVAIVSRQMGLTSMLSIYALWKALTTPNYKIAITGNKFSSINAIHDKITWFFDQLSRIEYEDTKINNKSCIEFTNGSKIKFVSASSLVETSNNFDLIMVDDAVYASYQHMRDIVKNVEGSNTRLILTSVAKEPSGPVYELYQKYKETNTITVPYWSHPDRDEKWAATFKQHLSDLCFRREFLCEFC